MQLVATEPGLSKENPEGGTTFSKRTSPRLPRWIPWAILVVAAFFRLAWLDLKPAHFDEGINGWFVDRMVENGHYKYDPTNYHGPLHFYVEFVSLQLFGRNLWALRLPVVLVGLLTVWMAWSFRRHFGERAAALAAVGLAVSPGFVFYQRYAIHETWLVWFLMMLAWGILEMRRWGSRRGLLALIAGATGCILTKETYLIHFVAMGLAFAACAVWQRCIPTVPVWNTDPQRWTEDDLWKYLALAFFALIFFYSGNFCHWQGLEGLFTTFLTWVKTGVDSAGHMKTEQQLTLSIGELPWWQNGALTFVPWRIQLNYYWLWLAWRFEPLMLPGVLAGLLALWRVSGPVRWLGMYGLATLCGYSLIAYKTPWCVISIAWPFYLLAGILLDRCLAWRGRFIVQLLIATALSYSVARTIELNFKRFDDDALPYVYVQTYRDIRLVLDPIASLLRRDPAQINLQGRIHLDSYYPLPWYFGGLPRVYCPKPGVYRKNEDSAFLICESDRVDELAARLQEAYYLVPFRLRSGQEPCTAFFNTDLFGPEFDNRAPDLPATAGLPIE